MSSAISIENVSKTYHLGQIGTGTFANDLNVWWAKVRGKPNPMLKINEKDHGNREGDDLWALRDINLTIQQGEVLGIIGRNGAGKSTLLKILSRVTSPSAGVVKIKGRIASLLEVGTGFHPDLTGRENIYLNGAILGMNRQEIQQKFDEIVDFSGVEQFIDTPVKRYSSGMFVRLAFAVAAHLETEILVVDEVLAVGDAEFQKKCLGKMGDVAHAGRTVLFVSHNMASIRKLCPKGILLEKGSVKLYGPIDHVIDGYLSVNAARYSAHVSLPENKESWSAGQGTDLRFFSKDNIPQTQFKINDPWKIVFEFEIKRKTRQVIAGIGILNIDQVPIITYWSMPEDLEPGKYKVEFLCDLPLRSMELNIAVGLSSYQHTFYYYEDVGHVSISEIATGEQPLRSGGRTLFTSVQERKIIPV